jgi:hypothetical protein
MFRILAVLIVCLGLGVALAFPEIPFFFHRGLVGAGFLVVGALAARFYWEKRALAKGDDPSGFERQAWALFAGTALIVGYMAVVLTRPGSEIHLRTGDTGGKVTWTMVGGLILAGYILKIRGEVRDERDLAIGRRAERVGYCVCVILIIALSLFLGFAPFPMRERVTHWLLGNMLIQLLSIAFLFQNGAMLWGYWRESRALGEEGR